MKDVIQTIKKRELTPKVYENYKKFSEMKRRQLLESIPNYKAPEHPIFLDYYAENFVWQHSKECQGIEYYPGTVSTSGCYICAAHFLISTVATLSEITNIAVSGDWHAKKLKDGKWVGAGTWRWFFDFVLPHYDLFTKYMSDFNSIVSVLNHGLPLIALLSKDFWKEQGMNREFNHVVVIIGADDNSFIVYDSVLGIVHYEAQSFMRHTLNLEAVFEKDLLHEIFMDSIKEGTKLNKTLPWDVLVSKEFWNKDEQIATNDRIVRIVAIDDDRFVVDEPGKGIVYYNAEEFQENIIYLDSVFSEDYTYDK